MSNIDHEAGMIEALNDILPDWREHYETLEEAAAELLEGYSCGEGYNDNDESELDFDEDWIT